MGAARLLIWIERPSSSVSCSAVTSVMLPAAIVTATCTLPNRVLTVDPVYVPSAGPEAAGVSAEVSVEGVLDSVLPVPSVLVLAPPDVDPVVPFVAASTGNDTDVPSLVVTLMPAW